MAKASGLAIAQIDQRVLDLALAAVAEAERRLQIQRERIAYLESLSVTDELTQVRNRRGFHGELTRALAEAARTDKGGVVLLIDLDGFKAINDVHGHAAGDFVLQTVASWLDGHVRPGDTVARLGGDEFAVLMPQTGDKNGGARAAELDRQLNRLTARWSGLKLKIRGSVGVAAYDPGDGAEDVLARADRTMYEKKNRRSGRPLRLVN
ncbi:MAG: GGDEF domain-containing protein [Alphaproteobacteria bacterium]|nr:GGDEF domain-containing protein [Alphaproteobacteria bacterium]